MSFVIICKHTKLACALPLCAECPINFQHTATDPPSPAAPESQTPEAVHAQLARKGPNFRGRIRDVIKALRGENEKTVDRAVGHLIGCCKGEMIFRRVALKEIERLERTLSLAQTEIKGLRAERDLHYTRLAGLLFSGALDKYTGGDVQSWAAEYTKKLTDAQARIAELVAGRDFQSARIDGIIKEESMAQNVLKKRCKEFEKLLCDAQENLVWCGGSTDFGWGGKAQVGYDKGPRATIAAIDAALKSRA